MLSVSVPTAFRPRPGLWKSIVSVFEKQAYFHLIRDFWSTWRRRKHLFPSLAKWWEVGKSRVKGLTISYCSRQSRSALQEHDLLVRLVKHLKGRWIVACFPVWGLIGVFLIGFPVSIPWPLRVPRFALGSSG